MKKIMLVILLLSSSQLFAQPFGKEEKEILEMQDTRDSKLNAKLYEYKNSKRVDSLKTILLGLSNISDTNSLNGIISTLLESKNGVVKILSAFTLGQILNKTSEDYLRMASAYENNELHNKNITLVSEILNSLGKVGSKESLDLISDFPPYYENDSLRQAVALSISRFGMRKIKSEKSFERLSNILSLTDNEEVLKNVAYAFNRAGEKIYLQPYKSQITNLTKSPNAFTRMWSFSALGKLQDTSTIDYMLESLEKENDWRVRVNICNALSNQKLDASSTYAEKVCDALLSHSTDDASTHVSIVALTALGKVFASGIESRSPVAEKIKQSIQFILTPNKAIDWQIKAEAIRTYAKIFKDGVKDELLSLFNQTENYDLKSAIIGSFASMNNPLVYKELRDSISADVQRYNVIHPNKDGSMIGSRDLAKIYQAFVETLAALDDKLDDENKNIIRLIFSEFSNSKYVPIVDVCLTNLQDSTYLKYRDETCQIMMFDVNELSHTNDADVLILYIQAIGSMKYNGAVEVLKTYLKSKNYDVAKASADALKNITGQDFEKEITAPKYRTDFDWEFIDRLNEKRIATIKTNQGEIKIELYPNIAPFTVQSFVKLAEKKFYDGTIFHRVVPNFVIQGGDPTGTGFGGPGYSIRTEISLSGFEEYSVGMASSGKDTEGSQFFITHSPQPHLDGRYTMFGRVIEGKDVVDKIQVGDKIESITFSNN